MLLTEFVYILQEIENGNNPRIEYNLHDGIHRLFGALGMRPSTFFESVICADSPIINLSGSVGSVTGTEGGVNGATIIKG